MTTLKGDLQAEAARGTTWEDELGAGGLVSLVDDPEGGEAGGTPMEDADVCCTIQEAAWKAGDWEGDPQVLERVRDANRRPHDWVNRIPGAGWCLYPGSPLQCSHPVRHLPLSWTAPVHRR